MIDYINAIKRGLRDQHGMTPRPESSEAEPLFESVPDGVYPMTIDGKLDHVRITDGQISCCNFEPRTTPGIAVP